MQNYNPVKMRSAASLSSASTSRWRPISGSTWGITAAGCGRGAQPQEREAAAQQAGAVRRGQHLRHRRRAGRQARADPRGHPGGQAAGQAAGEDMRSPLALSTCASRYGRATECSCYWLLNFPYVGVYPDGAHLLRPGGGDGHRADRRGGGVSPELSMELL